MTRILLFNPPLSEERSMRRSNNIGSWNSLSDALSFVRALTILSTFFNAVESTLFIMFERTALAFEFLRVCQRGRLTFGKVQIENSAKGIHLRLWFVCKIKMAHSVASDRTGQRSDFKIHDFSSGTDINQQMLRRCPKWLKSPRLRFCCFQIRNPYQSERRWR